MYIYIDNEGEARMRANKQVNFIIQKIKGPLEKGVWNKNSLDYYCNINGGIVQRRIPLDRKGEISDQTSIHVVQPNGKIDLVVWFTQIHSPFPWTRTARTLHLFRDTDN